MKKGPPLAGTRCGLDLEQVPGRSFCPGLVKIPVVDEQLRHTARTVVVDEISFLVTLPSFNVSVLRMKFHVMLNCALPIID